MYQSFTSKDRCADYRILHYAFGTRSQYFNCIIFFLERLFSMQVYRIPVLSDNYIFLLYDPDRHTVAVVDPAQAEPVLQQVRSLKAELIAIFNTHHDRDHVGGNQQLIDRFPQITVYGGAEDRGRIPGQQVFLHQGDRVEFGDRTAEIFFVPGHTKAHIAYYFPPSNPGETGELFCGDTLFAGGCGRLKEGTPAQMLASLEQLRNLPDNTRVWCAHEYTLTNLQFAISVEPDNPELQQRLAAVKEARSRSQPTIPSSIGIEKSTNPFLRWDFPSLQSVANSQDSVQTFARLRGMKDRF
jgi:hydroxyacylglutathione hydrolase